MPSPATKLTFVELPPWGPGGREKGKDAVNRHMNTNPARRTMKNVLIMLIAAVLLGSAGFFGTLQLVGSHHRAQRSTEAKPAASSNYLKQMQGLSAQHGQALQEINTELFYGAIGGGVGCVVGLIGSIVLLALLDRRKRTLTTGSGDPRPTS